MSEWESDWEGASSNIEKRREEEKIEKRRGEEKRGVKDPGGGKSLDVDIHKRGLLQI